MVSEIDYNVDATYIHIYTYIYVLLFYIFITPLTLSLLAIMHIFYIYQMRFVINKESDITGVQQRYKAYEVAVNTLRNVFNESFL